MLDHTSFIDGYIPSTHVLIEQKSIDKDLKKALDNQMVHFYHLFNKQRDILLSCHMMIDQGG